MSEASYQEYWDAKVPMEGLAGTRRFETPRQRLDNALNRFSRQAFVVMPNQLDRARSFRNRFIRAVQ